MSQEKKQWGAIIIMIALFAMIAFVTNLCTPMATIIKNQGEISNVLAQIGNYGNFVAYLIMGIPAGMLISKYGYKKTALIGLFVGIVGILIQWYSGQLDAKENLGLVFGVYLIGAFIAGLCMCILNCVVNPMLNLLGGGGNKGNQLIQIGGVFNSTAAVACYILMGALIADATKAKISDATPALMIALAIFVVAFIVIMMTKIEEPKQAPVKLDLIKGAMSHRHFALGALAIFLYMGVEVGVPTYVLQYLTSSPDAATPGVGMDAGVAATVAAMYWLLMLVGRLGGGLLAGKFSSRAQITTVATVCIILVLVGIFAPESATVTMYGFNGSQGSFIPAEVPMGVFALVLVGLCTSVMWGGIFNMAVEGLGKYTALASGMFMTMVCGGGILIPLQGWVADITGSFAASYIVVILCSAYILFYALIGSKNVNKNIPVA